MRTRGGHSEVRLTPSGVPRQVEPGGPRALRHRVEHHAETHIAFQRCDAALVELLHDNLFVIYSTGREEGLERVLNGDERQHQH